MLAPAVRGGEVEQWDEIKAAVSEALIEGGGTITHHHAVGRDHRPWYDRQRPAPFAAALRAAKAELDPAGDAQPRRADRPVATLCTWNLLKSREFLERGDPDLWRVNEEVRRRRLREDGKRPLSVNLAEGLALTDYLSRFTGSARKK